MRSTNFVFRAVTLKSTHIFVPQSVVTLMIKYRTRANKGRSYNSKIIFSAFRLPHKKRIKIIFKLDFLVGGF